MSSLSLFWKLLIAIAAVSLVAVVAFGLILSDRLQDQIVRQVDRRLHDSAQTLQSEFSEQATFEPSEALQQRLRRLSEETGIRYTLIAADGAVLADSHQTSLAAVRAMINHADLPEIIQARNVGEGRAVRVSGSRDEPYRYFAARVTVNGRLAGYVRSSLPMAEVTTQMAGVRRWAWAIAAIVWLCMTAAIAPIVAAIVRPARVLTEAASAIATGDYQQRIYLDRRDELGALGRTLDQIRQALHVRSNQIGQTLGQQSTVLGGMIEGVIAVDHRQRVVLANAAAGRLLRFPTAAVEGRPLLEVVRNHAVNEAVSTVLGTREAKRVETKLGMQQATSIPQSVDIHIQPLPGEPCPGAVLVLHDTTELRRLESLRRDFIANVSHELKTPLASIKAYTETLRDGAVHDPETSQKFLARIEEQSDRLHRLINDMLMLARIESDQQLFEIVPVDVPSVVTASLEDHRVAAEAKRIDLRVAPELPACRVRADREGLRAILSNLIDNAIKYTPEGGRVVVAWGVGRGAGGREPEGESPFVHISVRDTGIGIKPQDQERVFERFYRVDKARSREVGGTGLGLSIVKHLAQSFGGRVSVQSEIGQGSTFTVELPMA